MDAMHRVRLVDFTAEDTERIEPWFDDLETQHCKNPNAAGQSMWVSSREWGRVI